MLICLKGIEMLISGPVTTYEHITVAAFLSRTSFINIIMSNVETWTWYQWRTAFQFVCSKLFF